MTDDAQMIAAILADPDNDQPREVYAEWLKARGDPRGDFIELQLRGEAEGENGWRSRQAARAIEEAHGEAWVAGVKGLKVTAYRRGFPDAIFIAGEDFLTGVTEIFRTMPVRQVTFWGAAETMGRIAERPELQRLRAISLSKDVTVDGLRKLAASPRVSGLSSLAVDDLPIGDDGVKALAAGPSLRRLSTLSLVGCGIGTEGAERLADSPILAPVSELNLSSNRVAAGAARLLSSPQLAAIERLYLTDCWVDDAAGAALAGAASRFRLAELVLTDNSIGDEGAAALAGARNMPDLRILRLAENHIGDAGAAAFAAAPGLPHLQQLDLSSNAIGEAGAAALANATGLPGLKSLGLSYNPIYVPGASEDWRDWDGTWVGSGPVKADTTELTARYGRRFDIS